MEMKTTTKTTLATFAVCAILMVPFHGHGDYPERKEEITARLKPLKDNFNATHETTNVFHGCDEQLNEQTNEVEVSAVTTEAFSSRTYVELFEKLSVPVKTVAGEMLKADNAMKRIVESFDKYKKVLHSAETEYKKTYKVTKTDADKTKCSVDYLKKRGEIIKAILNDIEIATSEFDKVSETVNYLLGDIDANTELAAKAAEELAKTQELEEKIKEIKRKHVLLQTRENFRRGTPEHTKLHKDRRELLNEHERAMADFENAVYLSKVFAMCSTQLKVSGDQVEKWLASVDATLTSYRMSIMSLQAMQTADEIHIEEINPPKMFSKPIPKIPEANVFGKIPHRPKKWTEPQIDTVIDFDKLREEIRASFNFPKGNAK